MQWPPAFMSHPLVRAAMAAGRPWPLPLAIYLDGVRFTSPLAGRSDSILGIWAYHAVTFKRYYIMSLRSQDCCQCGCRNWCSVFPIMAALAWSLKALAEGRRPEQRHDGTAWDPSDPIRRLAGELGDVLPTAALVWLKGDWAEVHHSLGLPSVSSTHSPCPLCAAQRLDLQKCYRSLAFPPQLSTYEEMCAAREIKLVVRTEAERRRLLDVLPKMSHRLWARVAGEPRHLRCCAGCARPPCADQRHARCHAHQRPPCAIRGVFWANPPGHEATAPRRCGAPKLVVRPSARH